jgi:hypothetical protein
MMEMTAVTEKIFEPGDRRPVKAEQTVSVSAADLAVVESLGQEAAQADLIVIHKWDSTRRPFRLKEGKIVTQGAGLKPWNTWGKGTEFWIENVSAGLDVPGTWIREPSGRILYRPLPGEKMGRAEVPLIPRLLEIEGSPEEPVKDITISGITFRCTKFDIPEGGKEPAQAASQLSAAITADHAQNLTIEDCRVEHTGEYAIWLRRGCRDSSIKRTTMIDLGAGGVRIGEGSLPEEGGKQATFLTSHCKVTNSIITQGGRMDPSAVGVWIGASSDNEVTHCTISDLFYTGISIGWRWGYDPSPAKRNKINRCIIEDIGHGLLSDMGGVYTLGPSEGTTISDSIFRRIESSHYGGWGLYTDEGSTGVLFDGCLVYDTTSGGFHQHYGKENRVENCILAFSRDQLLQATRVEPHLSFTLDRCIILSDKTPFLAGPWDKVQIQMKNLLWCRLDGAEMEWLGHPKSWWEDKGIAENWIEGESPFVDAEGRDFRLKADSAASRIGFKESSWAEAGVRGRRMTAEWARISDQSGK